MARKKQTARKANQIPNLVDAVNATKEHQRLSKKSNQPVKEMAPIRSSKNKKDKLALVTPPSRPPRNTKYLNVGLLRGKTPSEVALLIREPRDPCDDSSELSSSSSLVISATGSIEEEVAEHDEIALGGEYVAYDDDDGNDGNGGDGGDGGNHGNEEEEIQEEEEDEGNDDGDEDENGGASGDEEGDEDDGNDENGS
ncbi:ribosomal L1 domain-containing protein CG13096-like [Papaver somniferum]|uniref:ribosomal L1 domain-containing protein CG13096-like n=1 Tax=Papaver somniferum TaxID=3469 RepID=UPI000E6F6EDB|nr:ribosomal L1 domain-containing protein CG13096-like [Papaver somniferum]